MFGKELNFGCNLQLTPNTNLLFLKLILKSLILIPMNMIHSVKYYFKEMVCYLIKGFTFI